MDAQNGGDATQMLRCRCRPSSSGEGREGGRAGPASRTACRVPAASAMAHAKQALNTVLTFFRKRELPPQIFLLEKTGTHVGLLLQ